MSQLEVENLINQLKLQPHPEGGYYRETFRDTQTKDGRALSTCIYYLLPEGQESKLHRIDATEIWHFYAGAPLNMQIGENLDDLKQRTLGTNISDDERPQLLVPPHHWQGAHSSGAWTLAGCTVSPGFEFAGFEMVK